MGTNRSQRGRRELNGVDSSGWDGQPIDYGGGIVCDPYTGTMTVGTNGSQAGYNTDIGDPFGSMSPVDINGLNIFQILHFGIGNGAGVMNMVGNAEIPTGAGRNLLITFGTYPEVEWQWNAGGGDYTPVILDAAWEAYIDSQIGNTIPICINWGAAGGGG